jgi:hypothetical protein
MSVNEMQFKRENNDGNFEEFVTSKLDYFQQVHADMLSSQQVAPIFTCNSVLVEGVIILEGTIHEEHDELFRSFAQRHGLSLPYTWHITLAYNYKPIPNEIADELADTIRQELSAFLTNTPTQMGVPQLCFYNDMTNFVPWDGSSCPFS